ncbi:MAG: CotH kinase family protein [bacterium]
MDKNLKHTVKLIAIFVCTLFLSACLDNGEVTVPQTEPDSSFQIEQESSSQTGLDSNSEIEQDPREEEENVETGLFLSDRVVEVRLELSDEAWQAMLADPQAEEYQEGNIVYNGIRLDKVAVRTKGQSSLMSVAGNPNSNRYSFKIDMNHYVKGQDLRGIEKLCLNNGFSDPTFMREYLSYDLMRAMDLPTPRTAFIDLSINNEHLGLYTAVEAVDDEFVKAHFERGDGDLYKAEMGSDLLWKGDNIDSYTTLELKTNEDTSDHSALLTMLDELDNGSDYEQVVNVDAMLRYLAVSTALTNLDSYQGSFAQNYYLYEENGLFTLIPWDLNMSFGAFSMSGNRTGIIEFMIDEPTMGKLSDRPLIAKLLENPDSLEAYHGYLSQLINGPLDPDTMEKTIKKTADLIRQYVYADPTKFYTNEEFEQALVSDLSANPNPSSDSDFNRGGGGNNVIGLVTFVRERVESIRNQLNGLAPARGDGSGNFQGNGGFAPQGEAQPSAIENVSPSYAEQGETNVAVTITLNQQAMALFADDIKPLSVKIGTVEGKDLSRNGLVITAVFDFPEDELTGMKDVSIEFPAPELPAPGEFQLPTDGTPLPGGFSPPGGLQPPPGGLQPPSGGFQPPFGGWPTQNNQSMIFIQADIFEIQPMR